MIVTCSHCAKRYVVDPRALGATGRRVRCANCQHTWFEAAPKDAPAATIHELPPRPESPPVVSDISADPSHRIQLPAVTRRRGGMIWLRRVALAALVVLAVWGLIAARQSVMSAVPFTTRLYTIVGLGPAVLGQGLELRQVTPSRGVDNGVATLGIDGQVANVSRGERAVPKLRVALRDSASKELQSWTVSVTDQPLAPGATVPFHTTIAQPPDGATDVVVSFAPSGS